MRKTVIRTVKHLLFPDRCPGCGQVLDMDQEGFCPICQKEIRLTAEPVCKRCGKPLEREAEEYCTDCKNTEHAFIQNKAYCVYEAGAKNAMYRLKYGNAKWVGEYFAKKLVAEHGDWLRWRRPEALIPVPVHPKRQRERGYNQAEVLAKYIAHQMTEVYGGEMPPVIPAVRRSRYTTPQKELSVTLRRKNLKKAFKLDKNVVKSRGIYPDSMKALFQRVLIVDDIYTTGATLDAVSELLLAGHIAQEVYAMTAVIGQNI